MSGAWERIMTFLYDRFLAKYRQSLPPIEGLPPPQEPELEQFDRDPDAFWDAVEDIRRRDAENRLTVALSRRLMATAEARRQAGHEPGPYP